MSGFPELPVAPEHLATYIAEHPETPLTEIMAPYRKYEAHIRGVFAQDRQNPALDDPHINLLPLFTQDTPKITTRARDLNAETEEEKSKYIMALPDDKRRAHGTPATVANIGEFRNNFNIFSESSLTELDWSNVVAAGSSVVNCLLPVPEEFNINKRKLREYYHEKFCPASDVDLFLYGLTHDQAIEKMKQIEQAVRDSVLQEITVVRTKYAVTIASQYPVRHIQIVLRVYKSIGEILTGFDIDAAGGAYDGKQVYVTPRALGSFISQINHVDLSRRSPSYENRLSKYSHRNFEVHWPELDRSRVDPTIFERSFQRTLGLARLLVLERLPTTSVREKYQNKRRQERGRPQLYRNHFQNFGDIKNRHEDEVADWLSEEEVSNYHTFTIPYGEKFNAKKIEKLCYSRDLLLNAEWNQPKERKVYIHRHPAFFGRVQDVIEDCCGSCPVPATEEEIETAEKEAEIYISGKVKFLIDDPGRQQIGSFNPLTEQDWTDMAYVGNTARLCQSIVNNDIDDVLNWLSQEGADPNQRDYTGRSPLHLAVMASTAEVVKCLVDHGARLTARLADGRTALHLAASRGNTDMIKILMEKSIENETVYEDAKISKLKSSKTVAPKVEDEGEDEDDDDEDDVELIEGKTDTDIMSVTTASFVKLEVKDGQDVTDDVVEDSPDEPDYYQIDLVAWDMPCSPLHLAIVEGHEEAVALLCDYGADAILPVRFLKEENKCILTLVLALKLPSDKAISMASCLLKLGAMCSQADTAGWTAFHDYIASGNNDAVDILFQNDKSAVKAAINHMAVSGQYWSANAISPLQTAIEAEDTILALRLLEAGANPSVDFETWLRSAKVGEGYKDSNSFERNKRNYAQSVEQPLISAIRYADTEVAFKLLDSGVNVNTLTPKGNELVANDNFQSWVQAETALDLATGIIKKLESYKPAAPGSPKTGIIEAREYLKTLRHGTYKHLLVSRDLANMEASVRDGAVVEAEAIQRKKSAIAIAVANLEKIRNRLISAGAKTFVELYPKYKFTGNDDRYDYQDYSRNAQVAKSYTFKAGFKHDGDLTNARSEGYMNLMQAAWDGDIDQIKSLTLQPWGPEKSNKPLKADITDSHNNSPFSIAFLRGHREAARLILDAVKAQWTPKEDDEVRYKLRNDDDEEDYESDCSENDSDMSDGDSNPEIVTEKINKALAIDNVGEVSMQVKSHTRPLTILTKHCNFCIAIKDKSKDSQDVQSGSLFQYVLREDDADGLKWLLDTAQSYSEPSTDDEDQDRDAKTFTFPVDDFTWAVSHGRVSLLRTIIKRTGAGLPLDHLIKKSGVEVKAKPRFYQGLTVYGKKRKDWATAGRNMVVRTVGLKTPPLLHAAMGGSIDAVEFFMSEAPHRLYAEFSKSKAGKEDKRLDVLRKNAGGFDRAVSKWLGADNEWVLHCSVMADPSEASLGTVKHLIELCPGALEKKSATGDTPLMLACKLGRYDVIKTLIDAGADQLTKNSNGENLIHAILGSTNAVCAVESALKLLDPEVRQQLFSQRRNLHIDGCTPLHAWVCGRHDNGQAEAKRREIDMVKMLLKYADVKTLEMLNGAGDTCLHTLIMSPKPSLGLIHEISKVSTKLLLRENAVGRTPAEVAHERVLSGYFQQPYRQVRYGYETLGVASMVNKREDTFQPTKETGSDEAAAKLRKLQDKMPLTFEYKPADLACVLRALGIQEVGPYPDDNIGENLRTRSTWDLCQSLLLHNEGKRRLVSLNEANDVAKRLGESHSSSRYFSVESRRDDDDEEKKEEDEDKKEDFVSTWSGSLTRTKWHVEARDGKRPEQCKTCGHRHHEDSFP